MRLRLCLVLLVLSSLVSLSGCAHHAQNGPSGNTLRVAMNAVPTTFDPAMAEDGNTIDLLQQVFEGLVQWTPKNTLAPALATKWDISNGGRTYTFHLRPNVKFQDGTSLTAQDVYFSLRRTLDPGLASPVAGYLSAIVGADAVAAGRATDLTGVRVIDPLTVAITLTAPRPYWIYTLTYPTDYILSPQEAKQNQVLTSDEVGAGAGTGPFRLTRYDTGARVLLAANPAYWGGAPKIAGQIRPIVIDAGARRNLYLTGQLDLVDEQKDALDADLKDPARRNQVQYFPRAETFYLGLNGHVFKPFADPRVRRWPMPPIRTRFARWRSKTVSMSPRIFCRKESPDGTPISKAFPMIPPKPEHCWLKRVIPAAKDFPPFHSRIKKATRTMPSSWIRFVRCGSRIWV
jgi:oligopeptide transport system substrate-binding protein